MIRTLAALALGMALAACGADGAPERPDPRPQPGFSISGTASVGLIGSR